jgi:nickel transport protein
MILKHQVLSLSVFMHMILIVLFLSSVPADAHKLSVFAYTEAGMVKGEAYFNDGSPAMKSPVTLLDQNEKILAETKSEEDGTFSFDLPKNVSLVTVRVNGGMGHMGSMSLEILPSPGIRAEVPDTKVKEKETETDTFRLSRSDLEKIINQAVDRHTDPLLHELASIRKELSKPDLTEILGGIGYIAGLTGFALWAKSRRSNG